jgi:kynurenine formamidase
LTFFMILEGPSWIERIYALMPPEPERRWRAVGSRVASAIHGYVTGNLLISLVAGTSSALVLLAVGAPFALALGLLVAILDLIPLAGATVAGIVIAIVASFTSLTAGIIVLVYFGLYQQVENHLLQPLVYGRTVELSPLVVLIVLLIGAEVAGILGALGAIPVAGTAQILLGDWLAHRGPRGSTRHLLDVSVTLRPSMPAYQGDTAVAIASARSTDRGDTVNVSRLALGTHSGTHVDAPRHVLPSAPGADALPLEAFVGPCVVAGVTPSNGTIDAAAIEALDFDDGVERVLLKTPNSRLWARDTFTRDFVRLDAGGARALIDRGVRLVGIDDLSIGDRDAHLVLLRRLVGVVEGLDLRAVEPGSYHLICLPLKIAGADGAPARVVLQTP